MSVEAPKVTVGLPVFQGERFLEQTVDALLVQTLTDFELVISDNGSSDATEALCRAYAERDPRVRYIRHGENRGAAWNHTFVALEARAPYFKWSAGDDVCEPTFLERCVDTLEADPTAVLAQPATIEIDEQGAELGPYEHRLRLDSDDLLERWTDLLNIGYGCYDVYGVIRTDALMRTNLMGSYVESDMVLLAELALYGRFAQIGEPLFRHRIHPGQSVRVHEDRYDRGAWFDATKAGRPTFPTWRFALEYLRAVRRADLDPAQRRECHRAVSAWAFAFKRHFARDIKRAQLTTGRTLRRKLARP